jgi:hypothetical protein
VQVVTVSSRDRQIAEEGQEGCFLWQITEGKLRGFHVTEIVEKRPDRKGCVPDRGCAG